MKPVALHQADEKRERSMLDAFAGSLSQQWVLTAGDVMTCQQLWLRRRLILNSRGHVKSSVSPSVADQALLTLILSGFERQNLAEGKKSVHTSSADCSSFTCGG